MVKSKSYRNKQIVLEFLRSCEFASLKDLCRFSGYLNNDMSENEGRAAIRALRKEGYVIEGLPFQGYSLCRFPDTLAEGLVYAKLPEQLRYNELMEYDLILFDSVSEADAYLCQHAADLPDHASMLVSPESNIDLNLPENRLKLFMTPVHLSILCKKQIHHRESFLHAVMTQTAALAIEQLADASKSAPELFRASYTGNEIHINDRFVGRVHFKDEADPGILHISLSLNQFDDKTFTNRSTLAARIIAVMHEFLAQDI